MSLTDEAICGRRLRDAGVEVIALGMVSRPCRFRSCSGSCGGCSKRPSPIWYKPGCITWIWWVVWPCAWRAFRCAGGGLGIGRCRHRQFAHQAGCSAVRTVVARLRDECSAATSRLRLLGLDDNGSERL